MKSRLLYFLLSSHLLFVLSHAACSVPAPPSPPSSLLSEDAYAEARRRMIQAIPLVYPGIDQKVLEVMERVTRHHFVLPQYINEAYDDHPLPIGEGQTISAPHMVAFMTALIGVKPGDRVLEIGTGSGYQAAVLAELTDNVFTVEIIEVLAQRAAQRLKELGYHKVAVKMGDGYYGWEEHAPYDAILVTAAPDHVPRPLVDQLKEGGKMVVPVGPPGSYQTLWLIEKKEGKVISTNKGGVLFVPLLRSR